MNKGDNRDHGITDQKKYMLHVIFGSLIKYLPLFILLDMVTFSFTSLIRMMHLIFFPFGLCIFSYNSNTMLNKNRFKLLSFWQMYIQLQA